MSDYYDHTGFPSTRSAGLSSSMRAEFDKIATGFGKLPVLTGNDGKALVVAGGGATVGLTTGTLTLSGNLIKSAVHALTLTTTATSSVTFPTTGTLSTLAGTETLSNKTISTTVASGHAFGTSPSSNIAFTILTTLTGPGSSTVYGFRHTNNITGGVSDEIVGTDIGGSYTKAASGTHAKVDGVRINTPTISGSATATDASSLRIVNAPTSGATNMYALFVDAGTSRFDGLVDLQSGQIKFPATQSASADVNTLDDYEEGTWTPSVGGSATYTSQIGTYTKIGRKVTINGTLVINTIGTGSTSNVSGIPFTNTGTTHGTGSVFFTSAATSYVSLVAEVGAGDNFVGFVGLTSAGGSMSTQSPMTSGTTLRFSVTYFV